MDAPQTLALLLDRVVDGSETRPDAETTTAILDEAQKFSRRYLAPRAEAADRHGCRLKSGRVRTPDGQIEAWHAYGEGGWAGLTAPEGAGGQALPMALATAVQELCDAADPAFGMLAINARCATRLLAQHGDEALKETWLPKLASGTWGATICISEPHAGSDVGRIRTRVSKGPNGWQITGEKCWISYGDHDLTDRIGHFTLARPEGAPVGTRGLSLFLVPGTRDDGTRNGIAVMRLEEKLGLHSSPTCMLAFENAEAVPIGPPGRGLPTLFAMIVAMRLGVAGQGAAVAQATSDVAERYARERGQGGDPAAPPTPIVGHAEVRRLLLAMRTRAEAARLLALETAATVDLGDGGDAAAAARASLLLPLAKTLCSEAAFANGDDAIQVLGGVGYVRDWPLERLLRDCRVFTIYEGTTAIQGLDLLQRRVLGSGGAEVLQDVLHRLAAAPKLESLVRETAAALATVAPRVQEAAAVPFLRLLSIAATDGLLRRAGERAGPLAAHYTALAAFHGAGALERANLLAARCLRNDVDGAFASVFDDTAAVN
jgi:alkylation response protein AidB-like acyl-CoA dehydrogenase